MTSVPVKSDLDTTGEAYVRLVLALGEHDPDYVDAFYGPAEWRKEAAAEKQPLDSIHHAAETLHARIAASAVPSGDPLLALRRSYLLRQTEALVARAGMLQGKKLTFDEESLALYDAVAPHHPDSYYAGLISELERELPGDGPLAERLDRFNNRFVIPSAKVDAVFRAAIAEARRRSLQHVTLPEGESFTVEYVTDKAWSGYNWYQGRYRSLIQVNTSLPIFIDRAIDLACHEGYPGHHVYNALLEKHLVDERGWVEFTVYPLFSPQSLIAEGSANYGIDVAFPGEERVEWEKANLWPLAGLDPGEATRYYRVHEIVAKLNYARNEAARYYLDGKMSREEAKAWLTKYALIAPERTEQQLRFIDTYRSYVINYNLGKDLVAHFVEALGGTAEQPARRWEVFEQLLASPRLPGDLR